MITRSERSGEKRNRIFSPGRRNRREKKLPFRLSFITKGDGGRVYPFTRFVNGEEAVLEESAGVSLVENQDIWLRFDGPPDFRFTMDGLYTAQVRADAAEQALQILAVLAAQSPESGGQNLSAAEKLCIMGRGLNRG